MLSRPYPRCAADPQGGKKVTGTLWSGGIIIHSFIHTTNTPLAPPRLRVGRTVGNKTGNTFLSSCLRKWLLSRNFKDETAPAVLRAEDRAFQTKEQHLGMWAGTELIWSGSRDQCSAGAPEDQGGLEGGGWWGARSTGLMGLVTNHRFFLKSIEKTTESFKPKSQTWLLWFFLERLPVLRRTLSSWRGDGIYPSAFTLSQVLEDLLGPEGLWRTRPLTASLSVSTLGLQNQMQQPGSHWVLEVAQPGKQSLGSGPSWLRDLWQMPLCACFILYK